MKITVTRTFKPITKEIDDCHDCPWFTTSDEGNSSLEMCEHPNFGKGGYDNVIPDITQRWKDPTPKISSRCPLVK